MGERFYLARRKLGHHGLEFCARILGVSDLQSVHRHDVVSHVGPGGGHLLRGVYVLLAQLDEAAALREAGQAGLDETRSGEAVQDYMDAFAVGSCQDLPAEIGTAAVEDMLDAQGAEEGLFRRAGGGKYFRAGR